MSEYRYLQRHDLFLRITHWTFSVGGTLLALTGLVLFVPGLNHALGYNVARITSTVHHVIGVLFVAVPIICWIIRPGNFIHTFKHILAKWDDDDKLFMKTFLPYLFKPGKYLMPKQHFAKSGQRLSDLGFYFVIFILMITGVLLMVGTPTLPVWLFSLSKLGHDLAFMGFAIIFPLHVYLGGGIFQPYRRMPRVMFGDGYISESDALYHWGHWADEELEAGNFVMKKP